MARRSPTLIGFKTAFSRPSFGLAEIAWRWSVGFAVASLLMFSAVEYLDSLPVTYRDELLFRTRQPALISRALSHILHGSSLRLMIAGVLLAIALSAAWILLSSIGRAATVNGLLALLRQEGEVSTPYHLRSLVGLNFLRLAATLAAAVGCISAVLLGSAVSPSDHPSPGSAMLICLFFLMLIVLTWCLLNWFLSLAAIFVVADGLDTFGSTAAAVGFCRDHLGAVLAANIWFGLAHMVAFSIASSAIAFPLAFAGLLPKGVVLSGMFLVVLLYFAVVDFLYVGRLAAHIAILLEPPPVPVQEVAVAFNSGIDRSELILSDLPNLIAET
jgi:hypothetical protein